MKTVTIPDRHVVEKATNEVRVFHGTEKKIADILVVQGFDDKVVKPTGNLYGSGLYFSPSACKAVQYTRKEDRDKKQSTLGPHNRYLLLCKVALGQPHLAEGPMEDYARPPCVENCRGPCAHARCNSIVANKGIPNGRGSQNHQELVVFHGRQVYLEYIIEFSGE